MRKYTPYPINDLGLGLDTYSEKGSVKPGMVTQINNLDPESSGLLSTRLGHERYYGSIPLRARVVNHIGDKITFQFDEAQSIALLDGGIGPIVVTGVLSPDNGSAAGDFSGTFNSVWYDTYTVTFRENFEAGQPASKDKNKTSTGIASNTVFFEAASAPDDLTSENIRLTMEEAYVDSALYDIQLNYQAWSDFTGFFYFLEVPATASLVYIEEFVEADFTLDSGLYKIDVPNITHGLNTLNFIVRVYELDSGDYYAIEPENIRINTINGTLTLEVNSTFDGRIIMYAAPDEDSDVFTIPNPDPAPGKDANTIYIPVTEAFHFVSLWAAETDSVVEVTPDDVRYNPATQELEIKYISYESNPEVITVNWVEADYLGNVIEVTDSTATSTNYTDINPEITVWGIEHDQIYRSAAVAGGSVHHIDNYNSEDKETVVVGLGGNVFQATPFEDGAVTYSMATLRMRGASRAVNPDEANTPLKLAPLFAPTSATFTRTRGLIKDSTVEGIYARVIKAEWVSGTLVNYTFQFENAVDLTNKIDTYDKLTIDNCGYVVNNGTYRVTAIPVASGTEVVIQVNNPNRTSASKDEVFIVASGNVFTDRVYVAANTEFIAGDEIGLDAVSTRHTVVASNPGPVVSSLYVDNIKSNLSIAIGLNVFIRRTSSIIPLRFGAFSNVENVVRGDMVRLTGYDRLFRVKNVNVEDTDTITVTVSGGIGLISRPLHKLNGGSIFQLFNNTTLAGEHVVASSSDKDNIRFEVDAPDGTYTNVKLLGRTIEIDERVLVEAGPDTTVATVDGRWTVIENPPTSTERAITTKIHHFDENPYTDQPFLKSAVVNDSMYFTNGFDEVKKFDGVSLMNAGLPPFQPWAFINVDESLPALPSGLQETVDFGDSDLAKKFLSVPTGIFKDGQRLRLSRTDGSAAVYITVAETVEAAAGKTNAYDLYFLEDLTAAQIAALSASNPQELTLTGSTLYRYYATIRMIDRNGAEIASATLGSEDLYVETYAASAIEVKILGLPVYPELDYDSIDIELYRTLGSSRGVGSFYRVARERVPYDNSTGYITVLDTVLDVSLTSASFDKVTTNFTGGNPGLTWTYPPKAKALTTADNRLVLGNIASPPKADIVFRKNENTYDLCMGDFNGSYIRFTKTNINDASSNADLVFSFEGTREVEFDPTSAITIGTNQITVASTAHGLVAGQWIYLFHRDKTANNSLRWAGWYRLHSVTTNAFVIKIKHSEDAGAGAATDVTCYVSSSASVSEITNRVPVWMGQNAYREVSPSQVNTSTDVFTISPHGCFTGMAVRWISSGNLPAPLVTDTDYYVISLNESQIKLATTYDNAIAGTAINITSTGTGTHVVSPAVLDGNFGQREFDTVPLEALVATKLSVAISAVMASEDPSNAYWQSQGTFPKPWLLAQSGQSFGLGEIYVQQMDAPNGALSITHTGMSNRVSVYINNLLYPNGTTASTEIKRFNSRLAFSYRKASELFDDVYSDRVDGTNVVDINPADGQEITAIIPFFGTSVFGAAQYAQSLVVFKTNSVYFVDIASRQVQKIQTQGQGCTAPNSIALSTNGIFFANNSGLYHLDWSNKITWRGRFLNGLWNTELNKDAISRLTGHNYRQGRKYKLSYPVNGSTDNSKVFVYDHSREELGQMGSWTVYDNHNATGWCNQRSDAFWGTTNGRVMKVRNTNTRYDYRDDDQPIAQSVTFGGIHYDLPNERKITDSVTLQFQNDVGTVTGVEVLTEQSLSGIFNSSGTISIPEGDTDATIRFSLSDRKGTHVRTKIVKEPVLNEKFQISALTYGVVSIGSDGVPQTNKFRR